MCGLLTLNTHSRRPTEAGYRLFSFSSSLKHFAYFLEFAVSFFIFFKANFSYFSFCFSLSLFI